MFQRLTIKVPHGSVQRRDTPPVVSARDDHAMEQILREQSEALRRLCEEAQRIQRDINEHLHRLRHAGDNYTGPDRRKKPRKR